MYTLFVSLSAMLLIGAAIDYVRLAWRGNTAPVLATWLLLLIMTFLACSLQWVDHGRDSIPRNIGMFGSLATNTIIVAGLSALYVRNKTFHIAFTRFQWICLVAGIAIAGLVPLTQNPFASHTLLQGIGLLAYLVTIRCLWKAETNSEPLRFWIICLVGNSCAIYSAWQKRDAYSLIYLCRVLPSLSVMILLIWRVKPRS